MGDQDSEVRRGVKERLEFIEFRLFWEGRINRADIMERFAISTPQASKDLSLYESLAPGNLAYDVSAKRYSASADFVPRFIEPNSNTFLSQLRNVADRNLSVGETWLGVVPPAEIVPIPTRRVNVSVLRSVLHAIEHRTAVQVFYQSMNEKRPGPMWRWIAPHALAHDGLRWHVRAFCSMTKDFKDFLLSRCLEVGEETSTEIKASQDRYWNEYFSVVLVPNPALSPEQQEVVAQDYCMEYGQVAVPVRKALLYYFNKRLRIDVAREKDRIKETPVVVLNDRAFQDALAEMEPHQPEK
ncbi:WYL domain-containing protein [Terriglobus tenax]|uniref:WYL domain-containing protein n=1 Tax=Terriglobus tenax TaxID=1111115 RepID=UPI0021E003BC|nr:WYL domain-containing protein [Terriglobus tenax]